MSEVINKSQQWLLERMVVVYFCLFTGSALGTSVITAFYGMRWNQMDWQDRIMIGILIFVNWSTVMMAFFNKAISRVQKGEFPIADGDTQMISRTATTCVATQQTVTEKAS